jgi:acyl-CoA thioester hydrolase
MTQDLGAPMAQARDTRPASDRLDPHRHDLRRYPLRFVTRSLYSDMDAFRHINNVAFSRWFEEGRADLNVRVFGVDALIDPPGGLQLLLARTLVEYLAPLSYPGEVTVATAVSQVGTSSYAVRHALFRDSLCVALGDTVMVKALRGRPEALNGDERATLMALTFDDRSR